MLQHYGDALAASSDEESADVSSSGMHEEFIKNPKETPAARRSRERAKEEEQCRRQCVLSPPPPSPPPPHPPPPTFTTEAAGPTPLTVRDETTEFIESQLTYEALYASGVIRGLHDVRRNVHGASSIADGVGLVARGGGDEVGRGGLSRSEASRSP